MGKCPESKRRVGLFQEGAHVTVDFDGTDEEAVVLYANGKFIFNFL